QYLGVAVPAGIGHEQMQYGVFRGGQGRRLSFHGDGFGPVVQGNAADGDLSGGGFRTAAQPGIPAQLRADPGQHFHGNKGLGDIVVGAYIQPQHLVLGFGFGGEQNNGHVGNLPDPGGGGDAVHDGHHHVQQNQMNFV